MTTFIQQKTDNDCALASIAMALGKEKWEDAWTQEELDSIIGKGVSDTDEWLTKHNLVRGVDFKAEYTHGLSSDVLANLLWGRKALISAHSVNSEKGNHLVYWDGFKVWDPQEGRPGKAAIKYLRSIVISRVTLLKA